MLIINLKLQLHLYPFHSRLWSPVKNEEIRLRKFLAYFYLQLNHGIDRLYSFPSKANLYISATYGFFAGVSAPNSTRRAYTLTT
jgi:hypothetical protein